MSESAGKLRQALQNLEGAIESHANVDPELLARLELAIDEIRATLERGSDQSADQPPRAEHETLSGQLTGVAREFEVSHPTLSGMVGSVIDALGRMGI
jgi:hypothetical protein